MLTRESYRFAKTVEPNTSGELKLRVPRDGFIKKVSIRIYVGAELALHIDPYIVRAKQFNEREDIISYVKEGKKYIDGDDDIFIFEVKKDVYIDDEIVVAYENVDLNYSYDFAVDMEIDYTEKPKVV